MHPFNLENLSDNHIPSFVFFFHDAIFTSKARETDLKEFQSALGLQTTIFSIAFAL